MGAAKASGKRQIESYEIKDQDDIFKDVNDTHYSKLIEDDGVDNQDEAYWEAHEGKKKSRFVVDADTDIVESNATLDQLWKAKKRPQKRKVEESDLKKDAVLQSVLAAIDDDDDDEIDLDLTRNKQSLHDQAIFAPSLRSLEHASAPEKKGTKRATPAAPTHLAPSIPKSSEEFDDKPQIDTAPTETFVDGDWFESQFKGDVFIQQAIPQAAPLDEKNGIPFFLLDICTDSKRNLFLSGKIKGSNNSFVSCFIRVDGCMRELFLYPREYTLEDSRDESSVTDLKVDFKQVHDEFKEYASAKISMGGSSRPRISMFKAQKVVKKYAFDARREGIPAVAEYMRVLYPFTDLELSRDFKGRTFSHTFGTKTTIIERFIIERKIMGPSWLLISNPTQVQHKFSHCSREIVIPSPDCVSVMDVPPNVQIPTLKVLSLNLQTVLIPGTHHHEIVMVSGVMQESVSVVGLSSLPSLTKFTIIRKLTKSSAWPAGLSMHTKNKKEIQLCRDEKELLNLLVGWIKRNDPDCINGHDIHQLANILFTRIEECKITNYSMFGRLKRPMGNNGKTGILPIDLASGRLFCDTLVSAKELIRESSYDLIDLSIPRLDAKEKVLLANHKLVQPEHVPDYFKAPIKNSNDDILALIRMSETNSWLALKLMISLNILPLTLQLTNICGNIWNRSLRSLRAERNEYLLLHNFFMKDYIAPENLSLIEKRARKRNQYDEDEPESKSRRRKPAYEGGMVLEPIKGFYDKIVVLLDFNSLYPSVIQEFNICFTTIEHWIGDADKPANLPSDSAPKSGVLPKVLEQLVGMRKGAKHVMKQAKTQKDRDQANIRQLALKLVANSMYGCLGFENSRFFCRPLASLITSKGRDALQLAVDIAQSLGYQVIYGDTDSIMVFTGTGDYPEAKKIADSVKEKINKKYRKLEVELDYTFKSLLLLKKKKYAGRVIKEDDSGKFSEYVEIKGIDIVRRDWCALAKNMGRFFVDTLLSGISQDAVLDALHQRLSNVGDKVRMATDDFTKTPIKLEDFIITRALAKLPKDYADKNNQPHVIVAIRMIQRGLHVHTGDHIPFIICKVDETQKDETANLSSLASRAFHPEEIRNAGGKLKIDVDYYLTSQILASITRLVDPINGVDQAQLANSLGLDSSRYQTNSRARHDDPFSVAPISRYDDVQRYKNCEPLNLTCHYCKTNITFSGCASGLKCPTEKCKGLVNINGGDAVISRDTARLINQLTIAIRSTINKYYQKVFNCDDSSCSRRTRQISMHGTGCFESGCSGTLQPEVSSASLFNQIKYFETLFDYGRTIRLLDQDDNNSKPGIVPQAHKNALARLYNCAQDHLNQSGFYIIPSSAYCSRIFGKEM